MKAVQQHKASAYCEQVCSVYDDQNDEKIKCENHGQSRIVIMHVISVNQFTIFYDNQLHIICTEHDALMKLVVFCLLVLHILLFKKLSFLIKLITL